MAEVEEQTRKKRKMGDKRESATTKWPKIKPKQNLNVSYLKNYDLFTVQNYLTSDESKAFVKTAESLGFTHQGSLGPAKGEAYRDNDRISVNDPVLADSVWQSGLSKLFSDIKIKGKVAVGLNPNIRFYRYSVGQRFGRHIDESVDLEDGKVTYYTLLIYLSGNGPKSRSRSKSSDSNDSPTEPLVGGETVFYGSRNSIVAEVAPVEGMALFHVHGDKCMLHEARNVSKGVKLMLGLIDETAVNSHFSGLFHPDVSKFHHGSHELSEKRGFVLCKRLNDPLGPRIAKECLI